MKIVILDCYTLNPGDISWTGFETLGDFTTYDRTPSDKIIERSEDADIILTNKTIINKDTIKKLPKLKYIGVLATGYNIVDVNAANERNIIVFIYRKSSIKGRKCLSIHNKRHSVR